jgi:hypothetical protein
MKKVENVEQTSDEKLMWKAQVFWSHRTWESQIIEQVPDHRIIWRSKGAKGHVDGAVTFHELAPELTRVVLVLEYHPQGLFERTGNLWRAQGRRARLELKHFARHVMREVMLHPDDMASDGWRGEIHEGKVVKDHQSALREERAEERPEEEEPEAAAEVEEPEAEEEEPEEEEEEQPRAEAEEEEEEEEEPEEEEEEEPEEEEEEEPEEEEEEEEKELARDRPGRERAERRVPRPRVEEPPSRPVRRRTAARRA